MAQWCPEVHPEVARHTWQTWQTWETWETWAATDVSSRTVLGPRQRVPGIGASGDRVFPGAPQNCGAFLSDGCARMCKVTTCWVSPVLKKGKHHGMMYRVPGTCHIGLPVLPRELATGETPGSMRSIQGIHSGTPVPVQSRLEGLKKLDRHTQMPARFIVFRSKTESPRDFS